MKIVLKGALRAGFIVLAAAVISALLVRYSPGAMVDERELSQKFSENSLAEIRAEQASRQDIGGNFAHYLKGLTKGDLGYSASNGAPVAWLIRDRAPETLREIGVGLALAWIVGFGFAIPGVRMNRAFIYSTAAAVAAGLLLSLPAPLVAYLSIATGAPVGIVMAIVIAPQVFRYSRNFLRQAYRAMDIETARANGIPETRIFVAHVLPASVPQFVTLAAISITMAIGAAIPIETICDTPGLGRLAWQAATARDLPLLVNLTMLIAVVTAVVMSLAEEFSE